MQGSTADSDEPSHGLAEAIDVCHNSRTLVRQLGALHLKQQSTSVVHLDKHTVGYF